MTVLPSGLIRGALMSGGTSAASLFYIEQAGGLYRISRAELIKALVRHSAVDAAGAAAQLQLYNDGVGAINGFGTSPNRLDLRSVGEFDFYSGAGPTKVAQLGTAGLLVPPLNMEKGAVVLTPGGAVQAGYIGFFKPASPTAQRIGYIGYDPTCLSIVTDSPHSVIFSTSKVGIGGPPAYSLDNLASFNGIHAQRLANGSTGNAAGAANYMVLSNLTNAYMTLEVQNNNGNPFGQIFCGAGIPTLYLNAQTGLWFNVGNVSRLALNSGALFPVADNTIALGGGANRFSVVYAATGTINTSARAEKASIVYLDRDALSDLRAANLLRVGARLARRVTSFKFRDAIEAKGEEDARFHIGWVWEDVVDDFAAEGFDAFKEGAVCRDPKFVQEIVETPHLVQQTEEHVEIATEIQVVDGVAREHKVERTVRRPVFNVVPVVDESGMPKMQKIGSRPRMVTNDEGVAVPLLDGRGAPIMDDILQPVMHEEPVMIEGEPQREVVAREVEGEFSQALRIDYIQSLCLAALAAGTTIPPEE